MHCCSSLNPDQLAQLVKHGQVCAVVLVRGGAPVRQALRVIHPFVTDARELSAWLLVVSCGVVALKS